MFSWQIKTNHVWQEGEHFGDNDLFFFFSFFSLFPSFCLGQELCQNSHNLLQISPTSTTVHVSFCILSRASAVACCWECTSSADYINLRLQILFLQNYFDYYTNLKETLKIYANSWQSEMMFRNILEPDKMLPSPYLLDTILLKWNDSS